MKQIKKQIKIALWNKVKSTYPIGTSKHTNALLEEDFESFIDEVVKICTIPAVVWRSEQLKCGNQNPPCAPNLKFGMLECCECSWSE